MSAGRPRAVGLALLCVAAIALAPRPACAMWAGADAETTATRPDTLRAAADTSGAVTDTLGVSPLSRYLGGLADSTDRRFGAIAAPIDTGGFAGMLASANWDSLERAHRRPYRLVAPWWRFDRTTGHVLG